MLAGKLKENTSSNVTMAVISFWNVMVREPYLSTMYFLNAFFIFSFLCADFILVQSSNFDFPDSLNSFRKFSIGSASNVIKVSNFLISLAARTRLTPSSEQI